MAYNEPAFKLGMELSNSYLNKPELEKESKKQHLSLSYIKIDFFEANYSNNYSYIEILFEKLIEKLNDEVIHYSFEKYDNHIGINACVISKESRVFINTWYDCDYITIDIYVPEYKNKSVKEFIKENLDNINSSIKKYKIRGKK
jgi:S-adenosylmethionine/arginine decarboxylase-like enzyme